MNRRKDKRDIDALTGRDNRIQQSPAAEGHGMIFFVEENKARVKAGVGPSSKLPRSHAGIVHADSERSQLTASNAFRNLKSFHLTAALAGKVFRGNPLPQMTRGMREPLIFQPIGIKVEKSIQVTEVTPRKMAEAEGQLLSRLREGNAWLQEHDNRRGQTGTVGAMAAME